MSNETITLEDAFKDVLAHLVAAHSLLERSPKTGAPSNKTFDMMLADYAASIERGRKAFAAHLSRAAEPVATILPQDPEFPAPEADLPIFSATAWKRLGALPPRTNLYAHPPEDAKGSLRALQTAVRFILANADKFEWSLQGMGMLRLYMGNTRLHIWDQSHAAPGVSMIHDHLQWGLRSTIVAGSLINQRYIEAINSKSARDYNCVTLKAGYGTKFMEKPKLTWLLPCAAEHYRPGDIYEQAPGEIHESKPQGIVVTLMEKSPTGSDLARVFWPLGTEWGSAEPRIASPQEVSDITAKARAEIDAAMAQELGDGE